MRKCRVGVRAMERLKNGDMGDWLICIRRMQSFSVCVIWIGDLGFNAHCVVVLGERDRYIQRVFVLMQMCGDWVRGMGSFGVGVTGVFVLW